MTFDELCKDFQKRKPCGPYLRSSLLGTSFWEDGSKSINDLLRDFLKTFDIPYINTMNGDVWFLLTDGWHNARYEKDGNTVRFYVLDYAEHSTGRK